MNKNSTGSNKDENLGGLNSSLQCHILPLLSTRRRMQFYRKTLFAQPSEDSKHKSTRKKERKKKKVGSN